MQQFSNDEMAELRSRIDQIHDLLAKGAGDEPPRPDPVFAIEEVQPRLIDQLSLSIQLRRLRKSHFGTAQMSGAVWDMMLDLMLANANGRTLSASDLATGAGVPLSSGLRMIAALEGAGLARRSIDERDRRRSIVRLTEAGAGKMASYFDKMNAAMRSGYSRAA